MSSTPSRLHVQLFDEATIATFIDERIVDDVVIESVGDHLLNLVEREGQSRLILNFENVRFLGSAMLAKLFTLKRKIEQAKGKLILCNLNTDIRPVLNFAPRGAFQICDNEQAALDAI